MKSLPKSADEIRQEAIPSYILLHDLLDEESKRRQAHLPRSTVKMVRTYTNDNIPILAWEVALNDEIEL